MYSFGPASKERMETIHPDLVLVAETALATSPMDFTITGGQRDEDEQNEAFESGNSKARYGESPHNVEPLSMAMDIAPYIDGGLDYDEDLMNELADHIKAVASKLYEDGKIDHEIEWGGDWNIKGFSDLPHWQIKHWKDVI